MAGWLDLATKFLRVTTRTFETDVRALTTDVGVVDLATVVRVSTLTAIVSGQSHYVYKGKSVTWSILQWP